MVGKTVETVGEDKTIWKGPILINPLVLLVGGKPNTKPYLIFVTDATDGVRVNFFLAGVNFYRFNAKNWQFTV